MKSEEGSAGFEDEILTVFSEVWKFMRGTVGVTRFFQPHKEAHNEYIIENLIMTLFSFCLKYFNDVESICTKICETMSVTKMQFSETIDLIILHVKN